MRMFRPILAALLILLLHSPVSAQSSPVTGRVVDPQGASVANAEISLIPNGGQRTRGARSCDDGAFSIDNVRPVQYSLLVRAPGFTESAQSLTVGASGTSRARTVVLLTPEEVDAASQKTVNFRPPGG